MRFMRWVGISTGFFICILLVFIASAPTILSTSLGHRAVLSIASHCYPGTVQIGSLSAGWWTGLEVRDIDVKDPNKKNVFSCKEISIKKPLYSFLFSLKDLGEISISEPSLHLYNENKPSPAVSYEKKPSNNTKRKSETHNETKTNIPNLRGHISITEAQLTAHAEEETIGSLKNGSLNLLLDTQHDSSGTIAADLSSKSSSSPISASFSLHELPSSTDRQGTLVLSCQNLPTELVSAFTDAFDPSLSTILVEAFGTKISYAATISISGQNIEIQSDLQSDNTCSTINASLNKDSVTIQKGILCAGSLTPKLFSALNPSPELQLLSPISCRIENMSPLSIDIQSFRPRTPINLQCSTQKPFSLQTGPRVPPTVLSFDSTISGIPEKIETTAHISATVAAHSSTVSFVTTVEPKETQALIAADVDFLVSNETLSQFGCPSSLDPQASTHLHISIPSLSLPFYSSNSRSILQSSFEGLVTVDLPMLRLQPDGSLMASLEKAECSISKTANTPFVSFNAKSKIPLVATGNPLIPSLVGPNGLFFEMTGQHNLEKNTLSIDKTALEGTNVHALFKDISISPTNGLQIQMKSPATISCTLPPTILPSSTTRPYALGQPVNLSLGISPLAVTFENASLRGKPIQATVSADNIIVQGKQSVGPFSLSCPVTFDIEKQKTTIEPKLSSKTQTIITGSLTGGISQSSDRPLSENICLDANLSISSFPSALLDLISSQPLSPVIGETFSSDLSATFRGLSAKGNRLSMTAKGPFWTCSTSINLNNHSLSSNGGNALDFEATLSPSWINSCKNLCHTTTTLTIKEPVTVHGSVSSFSADIGQLQSGSVWSFLDGVQLSSKIAVSPVLFIQDTRPLGSFSTITGFFDFNGSSRSVDFAIESPADGSAQSIGFNTKGTCSNLWDSNGLTIPKSAIKSSVNINQFPTRLLEFASPHQGELLETAIGKTIQATGSLSCEEMKKGSATLDIQSKNCTVHFMGTLENGTLVLKDPAQASLVITKEAGTLLLKNVHPLLATAMRSAKPLQLKIDPQGVSIPINPFSLSSVRIPHVSVDVGQIVVKNGGALKIILAVLGMGNAANGEDLNVWLTPMYLSCMNGTITCQRTDALVADKIHMITWGTVDTTRDNINMVVAIHPKTLEDLHLSLVSPTPERGLQIPITGSISNPNIDTKRATARLAGAGVTNATIDPRVKLLGGIIQAAAAATGEPDQPIPPQTTNPLPWQK